MASIEPDLYNRIQKTLLECSEFESYSRLKNIFVDERIHPWINQLPKDTTPQALIRATIAFLNGKIHADLGENGLVLLLMVLSEQIDPKDKLHKDLVQLARELKISQPITPLPLTTRLGKIPHSRYIAVGVIGCLVFAIVIGIIAIPSLTLIYRNFFTLPTPNSITRVTQILPTLNTTTATHTTAPVSTSAPTNTTAPTDTATLVATVAIATTTMPTDTAANTAAPDNTAMPTAPMPTTAATPIAAPAPTPTVPITVTITDIEIAITAAKVASSTLIASESYAKKQTSIANATMQANNALATLQADDATLQASDAYTNMQTTKGVAATTVASDAAATLQFDINFYKAQSVYVTYEAARGAVETIVAEATAQGTPPAMLQQIPKNSGTTIVPFGYGIQADPRGNTIENIGHLQTLGFNWVKFQMAWKDTELIRGSYSWSLWDQIIDAYSANGIKVMLSIPKAPDWARPADDDRSVEGPPANPDDYAKFVATVADRYRGRVGAIEIWNEQNLWYEAGGKGRINAAAYTQLLRLSYNAIKSVNKDMIVISGALTPAGNVGDLATDDIDYLRQMYANGAKGFFDVLGAHPYGFNCPAMAQWTSVTPEEAAADPGRGTFTNRHHSWCFLGTMEGYRQVMIENGDSGKSISPTEFGWTATSNPEPGYKYARDNTEEERAKWVVEAFQWGKKTGWVGPMFLWNLDYGVTAAGTSLAYFGIINTPSYDALANMQKESVATPTRAPTKMLTAKLAENFAAPSTSNILSIVVAIQDSKNNWIGGLRIVGTDPNGVVTKSDPSVLQEVVHTQADSSVIKSGNVKFEPQPVARYITGTWSFHLETVEGKQVSDSFSVTMDEENRSLYFFRFVTN